MVKSAVLAALLSQRKPIIRHIERLRNRPAIIVRNAFDIGPIYYVRGLYGLKSLIIYQIALLL